MGAIEKARWNRGVVESGLKEGKKVRSRAKERIQPLAGVK
jgi:hypothetical protein